MKIQLPQYSGKDNLVMIGIVPLFALSINSLIFGETYFTNWKIFAGATIISSLSFMADFIYQV